MNETEPHDRPALADLESIASEAERVLWAAKHEMYEYKQARTKAFNDALDAECREMFASRVSEASAAARAAVGAVEAEKERIALSGDSAPLPLGTRLEEWHQDRWSKTESRTGRVGIFEAITATSEHMSNKVWGRAKRGDYVVRLLKKDGSPAKKYERWTDYVARVWRPKAGQLSSTTPASFPADEVATNK